MRTFIAIKLPLAIQNQLQRWQNQLQQQLAQDGLVGAIRWTAPANIHLTLRFLGETSDSQCSRLQQMLVALIQPVAAFQLALNPIGCFPSWRAPNIIWAGIAGETERLGRLQVKIERLVQQAGFAPESKPFRPHLTIGRTARGRERIKLAQIGESLQKVQLCGVYQEAGASQQCNDIAKEFPVQEILHIQSQLQPAGPLYTPLAQFALTEKS